MPKVIHTKPKIKSTKTHKYHIIPAISYALITILSPVISVVANYSSVYATDAEESFNFSVTVTNTPLIELRLSQSSVNIDVTPQISAAGFSTTNTPLTVTAGTTGAAGYTLAMTTNDTALTRTEALTDGTKPKILSQVVILFLILIHGLMRVTKIRKMVTVGNMAITATSQPHLPVPSRGKQPYRTRLMIYVLRDGGCQLVVLLVVNILP